MSAGEKIVINNIIGIAIIILNVLEITIYLQMIGNPINVIEEVIKQTKLFFACKPNDTVLIPLNKNNRIITSFVIPKIIEITKININFVKVK